MLKKIIKKMLIVIQFFLFIEIIWLIIRFYKYTIIFPWSIEGKILDIIFYSIPIIAIFMLIFHTVFFIRYLLKKNTKKIIRSLMFAFFNIATVFCFIVVLFWGTPRLIQFLEPLYIWNEDLAVKISIDRCNWIINEGVSGSWVSDFSDELWRIDSKIKNKRILLDKILENNDPNTFRTAFDMILFHEFDDGKEILSKYLNDRRICLMTEVSYLAEKYITLLENKKENIPNE